MDKKKKQFYDTRKFFSKDAGYSYIENKEPRYKPNAFQKIIQNGSQI